LKEENAELKNSIADAERKMAVLEKMVEQNKNDIRALKQAVNNLKTAPLLKPPEPKKGIQ